MRYKYLKNSVFVIAIAAGFAVIFLLSNFLQAARPPLPDNYADEDLALQAGRIKNYSLGFNGLMADWYWMQTLQYVGNKVLKSDAKKLDLEDLRPLNPRLLYPILDAATTLDPRFMTPYAYGAIVLPAVDPQQAIAITQKGIANNPGYWRLYDQLGYIYWRLGDFPKAAEAYKRGSEIEGAPAFMQMMSAKMLNAGGSRETARSIYAEMLAASDDDQTKENARIRLLEMNSFDERDAIDSALTQSKGRTGRCPDDLSELLPVLRNVDLPGQRDFGVNPAGELVDPSGAPYLLDRAACVVRLDPARTKLPLR